MRITLPEDNHPQAMPRAHRLADAGMTNAPLGTSAEFRKGISRQPADLIRLDWLLPDDDGVDLLVGLHEIHRSETLACIHTLSRHSDSLTPRNGFALSAVYRNVYRLAYQAANRVRTHKD